MPRKFIDLTLELRSPVQIGAGAIGFIERTELYIPGRVLWGALTNVLTYSLSENPESEDFCSVGEALGADGIQFGALFPSIDRGESIFKPRFVTENEAWERELTEKCEGWSWSRGAGNQRLWWRAAPESATATVCVEEAALRSQITTSLAGTHYNPRRSAENAQLYATDLLVPVQWSGRSATPLSFRGVIALPSSVTLGNSTLDLNVETLKNLIARVRLGGGRRRGWGCVRAACIREAERPYVFQRGRDFTWLLTSDVALIPEHEGAYGRTFLATYRKYDASARGARGRGYGQTYSEPRLCWEIGTILPEKASFEHVDVA